MDYCALSAAPVGRFVLDVHEEDPSMWAASDALCSALQIINHLQDCAEDYRAAQPGLPAARYSRRARSLCGDAGRVEGAASLARRAR